MSHQNDNLKNRGSRLMYAYKTLLGNIGKDAELKQTKSGHSVASFNVACSRKAKDEYVTDWFRVTIWGKFAEALERKLTKGTLVFVSGTPKVEQWEKNGVKHERENLLADTVRIVKSTGEREEFTDDTRNWDEESQGQFEADDDVPF